MVVLYEEQLLPYILSREAVELVEAVADAAETQRPQQMAPRTAPPVHLPDLCAIRSTSVSQRAHGLGDLRQHRLEVRAGTDHGQRQELHEHEKAIYANVAGVDP